MAHGREHSNNKVLAFLELSLDLAGEVLRELRKSDVLTTGASVLHEGSEAFLVDVHERVHLAGHERDMSGVSGRDDILILLASEDIDGSEVALGVTVLARLGSGHSAHLRCRETVQIKSKTDF